MAAEPGALREIARLDGGAGDVLAVAASPDGTRLAAGGRDRTARVWALPGGDALVLTGHNGAVAGVAFSPDGRTLAAASQRLKIWLWSVADGAAGPVLDEHAGALEGVAWSAQGVIAAPWNSWSIGYVTLSDPGQGKPLQILQTNHGEMASGVAFSPGGNMLAVALAGGTVALWEVPTGQRVDTLRAHGAAVRSVAWSPGGERLLTASADGTAKISSLSGGGPPLTLKSSWPVYDAAWSPDGTQVVTGSAEVAVWDAATGARLAKHDGKAKAVAWSAGGWIAAAQGREVVVLEVEG